MKAIIEASGKQFLVEKEQLVYFDTLNKNSGDHVSFDKVLYMNGNFGDPYLKNAKVTGIIEKNGKHKKIIVFKYKPKKNSKTKRGHAQGYTRVKILELIQK